MDAELIAIEWPSEAGFILIPPEWLDPSTHALYTAPDKQPDVVPEAKPKRKASAKP
jgi:hypothetical protein